MHDLELAIKALFTAELALEPDADDAERAQAMREVSDTIDALGRRPGKQRKPDAFDARTTKIDYELD